MASIFSCLSQTHELRTPMNAVIGLAEMLRKQPLPERLHDYLDKILAAGRDLLRMINDILDYSKVEAGCLALERTPFALEDLLQDFERNLAERTRGLAPNLHLQRIFHGSTRLAGDPARIVKTLSAATDLLLDHGASGRLFCQCETRAFGRGESLVLFHLWCPDSLPADTPFTLPVEEDFAFDPDQEYTAGVLSLALCRCLWRLMGGDLVLDWDGPSVSFGAPFTTLEEEPPARRPAPGDNRAVSLAGLRVLPAEDNPVNAEIARVVLQNAGVRVVQAADGREALAASLKAGGRALEAAQKASDRANFFKSRFLTCMNHEIRTSMNTIIGLAHLASRAGLDGPQREAMLKIQSAGLTLMGLVDNTANAPDSSEQASSLNNSFFSVDAVLDNLITMLGGQAEAKGIFFRAEVPPGLPILRGDPLRLSQALINLAGNAVKFTEKGGVTVCCRSAGPDDAELFGPTTAPGVSQEEFRLAFRIEDSGIGMSRDMLRNLFTPYVQESAATSRRYGSTGLGMPISRHIVESMGGRLLTASVLGRGTVFRFGARLTPAPAAELPDRPAPAKKNATPDAPPSLAGKTVLVAEDNAVNRLVACGLLAETGARVLTAEDGQTVLELFPQDPEAPLPVDLILMDLQIPRLDGFEATRLLRLRPGCRNLPIVAMTAYAMPEEQERCLAAGMDDHLAKPIAVDRFYAALRRHLFKDPALPRPARRLPPTTPAVGAMSEIVARNDADTRPPLLPGVDTDGAVNRLGRNLPLYLRLLRRFLAGREKFRVDIGEALEVPAKTETLDRVAGFKSLAAVLGASDLRDRADALEAGLREGKSNFLPELGDACLKSFDHFADLVERAFPPESAGKG